MFLGLLKRNGGFVCSIHVTEEEDEGWAYLRSACNQST